LSSATLRTLLGSVGAGIHWAVFIDYHFWSWLLLMVSIERMAVLWCCRNINLRKWKACAR
jgi:hypothetical protein